MTLESYTGVAVSIVTKNGIELIETAGFANKEILKPITEDTLFLVASISKLFVGVGILLLTEQSKFDLDEDINKYLTIKIHHPSGKKITARHLLQHRSGLRDAENPILLKKWREVPPSNYEGDYSYSVPLEEIVRQHLTESGQWYYDCAWSVEPPGECEFFYSNAGYTLLGYLIEQVSSLNFYDFMQKKIFAPLKLNTATWKVPESQDKLAVPYSVDGTSYGHYSVAQFPACQLRISIGELSRFLLLFTKGDVDGVRLLNDESLSVMFPNDFKSSISWWPDVGKSSFSHGGDMKGVRSDITFFPKSKSGYIILTNGEQKRSPLVSWISQKQWFSFCQ